MPEGVFTRKPDSYLLSALGTIDAGMVFQLPTGEAAVMIADTAVSSGSETEDIKTEGKFTLEKTTGLVFLPGQEVWWDYSANKAHYLRTNDRDFLVGIAVNGASSAAITVLVDLNKRCQAFTSLLDGSVICTTTGTHAAGLNGFGFPKRLGKNAIFELSSTNEAQAVDYMGTDCWDKGAKWIAQFLFKIETGGAAAEPDFNLGVSNTTHASDFDSIAEYLALHIDGNSTNLNLQSKDGTTTVASTDTATDYTAGTAVSSRVHLMIDGRTLTDIQVYINGSNVLPSSVFRLDNATGPLRLIAHLEKTAAATAFRMHLEEARAWYAEQGAAV